MSEIIVRPAASPFADRETVHNLMQEAVLDALRDHKKAGNPVAVWEDGKVKIIQPEDMVLPDEPK
jgi:hypothetical protein